MTGRAWKLTQQSDRRRELAKRASKTQISYLKIKRVYYLYDVPSDGSRGGHAHKKLNQFLIPLSGSFDVIVDDGSSKKTFSLNKPNKGLYIPNGIWREMENFSAGAICLVLASDFYDESDYFRDYKRFIQFKNT